MTQRPHLHLPVAARAAVLTAIALLVTGCAGMTEREKAIAVGAGAGAVGGAILTGGSAIGTAGGAAVGGIIGNEVDKKRWLKSTANPILDGRGRITACTAFKPLWFNKEQRLKRAQRHMSQD
jgi:osmotically inducible lipoprotein OsmB